MDCKYCKADCIFKGEQQTKECKGYIPMTNADRIRAMSDEELAHFLNTRGCPSEDQSNCFEMSCEHCWEKWLKQPAE